MPAFLKAIKEKISPAAVRENSRLKGRIESFTFYRECVFCDACGKNYDAERAGEAMNVLDFPAELWDLDLSVARDFQGESEFEKGFDAEMDRLNKVATEFPLEDSHVTWGFVLAIMSRLRNPNAFRDRPLSVPPVVLEALGKLQTIPGAKDRHRNRMQTLKTFKKYNPRLFSDDLSAAVEHKFPAIRLAKVDQVTATTNGNSSPFFAGPPAIDEAIRQ